MICLIFYMFIVNNLGRCASLYRHVNYRDLITHVHNWHNAILVGNDNDAVSSIKVTGGCNLVAWEDYDRTVWMFTARKNIAWLPGNGSIGSHNDRMSSARCTCRN